MNNRALLATLLTACCLAGCAGTQRGMVVGMPLEVQRGACFVHTTYKQQGEEVSWDNVTRKLSRFQDSRPYVSEGNTYAIGSIAAAVVASPAIVIGAAGQRGQIDMSSGLSTGLIGGGLAVALAGLVMCIVSDSKYATAGDVYNARLMRSEQPVDDRANENPPPSK